MNVKKFKSEVKQRHKLSMHPFEPVFTVYDGQVAYVMRIEMQPEVPGLLSDKNRLFFLMRLAFSFPGLSNTLKLNAALAKELLINT